MEITYTGRQSGGHLPAGNGEYMAVSVVERQIFGGSGWMIGNDPEPIVRRNSLYGFVLLETVIADTEPGRIIPTRYNTVIHDSLTE